MSEHANLEHEHCLDDQDPLRHLRSPHADGILIPIQLPSILNQRTDLLIPGLNPGDPGITVKLALDATHGCGGVAWPAGEASNLFRRGRSWGESLSSVSDLPSPMHDEPRSLVRISSNEVPLLSKTKSSLSWAVELVW